MPHMGIMALWCDGRIMRNPELSTGMRVTRASEHPWKDSLGPEERKVVLQVVAGAARAGGGGQDADSQCYKHEGMMDLSLTFILEEDTGKGAAPGANICSLQEPEQALGAAHRLR